jgi:hypothetical protein
MITYLALVVKIAKADPLVREDRKSAWQDPGIPGKTSEEHPSSIVYHLSFFRLACSS